MNAISLLAGLPIYVDNIPVYSPKLLQVALVDEQIYNLYYCLCVNELTSQKNEDENKFDNILHYTDEVLDLFYLGLKFFTNQDFKKGFIGNEVVFVAEGNMYLHKGNYDEFIKALKIANSNEEKTVKHNSELDRKIEEAKKKISGKTDENRNNDSNNIRLMDLISVLASKHNNLNIINIWDLNLYQFNDQFKRMQLIENFEIGFRQLLAGADSKKIKLEHYIKKI